MANSSYSIHLLKAMKDLDLDGIFPKPISKRKAAFKLIVDGMTISEWQHRVLQAGLEKVDISFVTQCYAKNEPHRLEPKLVELRPPLNKF